jgi:hypothetical protein
MTQHCVFAASLGGCLLKLEPDRRRSKNDASKLPQPKVFIVFTSNFTENIRESLDVVKVRINFRFGYGPIDTKD